MRKRALAVKPKTWTETPVEHQPAVLLPPEPQVWDQEAEAHKQRLLQQQNQQERPALRFNPWDVDLKKLVL